MGALAFGHWWLASFAGKSFRGWLNVWQKGQLQHNFKWLSTYWYLLSPKAKSTWFVDRLLHDDVKHMATVSDCSFQLCMSTPRDNINKSVCQLQSKKMQDFKGVIISCLCSVHNFACKLCCLSFCAWYGRRWQTWTSLHRLKLSLGKLPIATK